MVYALLIILMLVLTAFYHGAEIMYKVSNKLSIEILKSKKPGIAQILSDLYNHPRFFITTVLIGAVFFMVMYTMLFSRVLLPFFSTFIPDLPVLSLLLSVVIMALILIVTGLYLPKLLFGLYANELIIFLAWPLFVSKWIFSLPGWLLIKVSDGLARLFYGRKSKSDEAHFTKDDLESYIQTNVNEEKEIDKEILNNALNLSQLKVRDCMIPRNEIVFVDIKDSVSEVKEVFLESKHSRLVVIDDDLEDVVGYIHHQQLFSQIDKVNGIIMQIDIVPAVMNVQDLMYKFIKQGTNIACVVDEFGCTAGLITLEDILEEIFGEIDDEHDDEVYTEEQISDGEFIFSGRLELAYINDKYPQFDLPEDDYTTLSGYIVMTLGSIPEVGEEIDIDSYVFNVLTRSETKIEEVKVRIKSNL